MTELSVIFDGEEELSRKFNLLIEKISNNSGFLNKLAVLVKNNIFLRTNAGQDSDFNQFKRYNKYYAIKHGKTTVNLTLTGEMLNSISQKILKNNSIVLFFKTARARKLAKYHNIDGAGKGKVIRNFFAVNPKDNQLVLNEYQKEVKRVMEQIKI